MENNTEFTSFPKMARLSRDIIITEKIDGTNAQVFITEDGDIFAGSRNRWITPLDDNYGFAKWVKNNKQELLKLGAGKHFGEWWGGGIQRGYGLEKNDKRFSLFNVTRWCLHNKEPQLIPNNDPSIIKYQEILPECVGLVPIMHKGTFDTAIINFALQELRINGSYASLGFKNPEGIVIYHTASNTCFKKTVRDDSVPKSKIKV